MSENIKKSFVSLMLLQVSGYIIPLVVFPWLSRALGVEGFGLLGFATAMIAYFVLLVEWGFTLGSTSAVASLSSADVDERSKIFFETVYARFMLLVIATLMLVALVAFIEKLKICWPIYLIGWVTLLNAALSPSFYFQGIHKTSVLALANFVSRLLSVPFLMLLVQKPDQVALAFGIQMAFLMAPTLWSLSYLVRNRMLIRVKLRVVDVTNRLRSGFALFVSTAGVSLLTNSNAVILGFVMGDAATGYFVAGFTLVKSVTNILSPFGQVVFPHAATKIAEEGEEAGHFLQKALVIQCAAGVILSVSIWLGGGYAVDILYGTQFALAKSLVSVMAPLPILIALATFFGTQILIPMGESRYFSIALLSAGLINIVLMFILVPSYQLTGAAISIVLSEFAIALLMILGCRIRVRNMWKSIIRMS